MRMHSYEFKILRPASGETQNDIFRQALGFWDLREQELNPK
jgi:hypothetical protein